MTPQELKNSILQLAIHGRLVEQRSEEGTAEELYKQIQSEKQRLIKEGRIKKEKPLPEITEDEKPFEIPESWMWVRFGFISQLLDGEKRSNEHHPCLDARYLRGKTEATILDCGKLIFKGTRTILVDGENSGEVFQVSEDGYMGSTFKVLYFADALCAQYVLFFLLLHKSDYRNNKKGSAIPHLNKELFFNMPFPIPPLAEQKRIVAKIEELLPYIDRYEQAWSKLEDFNKRFPVDMQKSILQTAIQGKLVEQRPEEGTGEELYKQIQAEKQRLIKEGRIKKEKPLPEITEDEVPFEIPESWMWVRFGNTVSECFQGINTAGNHVQFVKEDGIPIIQTGDMSSGRISLDGTKLMSQKDYEIYNKKYQPRYNDIFYCNIGTIGRPLIYRENYTMLFHWNIFVIRYEPTLVLPEYLLHYLQYITDYFKSNTDGTAMQFVSKKKITNVLFSLPPFAEQKRIVAKLEELLPLC